MNVQGVYITAPAKAGLLFNYKGVYKTAAATPGLLKKCILSKN